MCLAHLQLAQLYMSGNHVTVEYGTVTGHAQGTRQPGAMYKAQDADALRGFNSEMVRARHMNCLHVLGT